MRDLSFSRVIRSFATFLAFALGAASVLRSEVYMGDLRTYRKADPIVRPDSIHFTQRAGDWIGIDTYNDTFRSTDGGASWEFQLDPAPTVVVVDMAFGNGTWVQVVTHGIRYSNDEGSTWAYGTHPVTWSDAPVQRCAFVNGHFLAWPRTRTTDAHGVLLHSTDGITWQEAQGLPSSAGFGTVGFSASTGTYSVVTDLAQVYSSSSLDGPWQLEFSPDYPMGIRPDLAAISADGQICIIAYYDTMNADAFGWRDDIPDHDALEIRRSAGGQWTTQPINDTGYGFSHLRTDGTRFFLYSNSPAVRSSSTPGVWTDPETIDTELKDDSVEYLNGWWFALDQKGESLYRSSDFVHWESVGTVKTGPSPLVKLASDGTSSVIAVGGEIFRIDLQDDSTQTYALPSGLGSTATAAFWDGSQYVVIGKGRAVQTSPDGITWTAVRPSEGDVKDLDAGAFGNGVYVASGGFGAFQSTDLQTWTETLSYTSGTQTELTFEDGQFWLSMSVGRWSSNLPGGGSGPIALYRSPDGINWEPVLTPPSAYKPFSMYGFAGGWGYGTGGGYRWDGTYLQYSSTSGYTSQVAGNANYTIAMSTSTVPNVVPIGDENARWMTPKYAAFSSTLAVADLIFAGDRFFYLRGVIGVVGSFKLDDQPVVDPRGPGTLYLFTVGGKEGANKSNPYLVVRREVGSVGSVSITASTVAGGTASPEIDYESATNTATWAEGETGTRYVLMPNIMNDSVAEGDETILVECAVTAGGAVLVPASGQVVLTIKDRRFDHWRFHSLSDPNGPSGALTADPDGDGITNEDEFTLMLDPEVSDAWRLQQWMRPTFYPGIGQLSWHFVLNDPDAGSSRTIPYVTSDSLDLWSAPTAPDWSSGYGTSGETVQLDVPADGSTLLMRLNLATPTSE